MSKELLRIILELHGKDVVKDIIQISALLEELSKYDVDDTDKRMQIQEAYHEYYQYPYFSDEYDYFYPYCDWFNDTFIPDYEKALNELLPSDKELCLLRKAREAGRKCVSMSTCAEFFKLYNLNSSEQTMFWIEYYQHRF